MKKIKAELTQAEAELAQAANTGHTGNLNEARVVAQLYVAKVVRRAADDVIDANERLAEASNRTAVALNVLTAGLVLVGIAQAVIIWKVSNP